MTPSQNSTKKLGRVISASRRTDLLAHYPDDLAARLRKIGPENIHTVVLWTKDAANVLEHRAVRAVLSEVGQAFLHWTITGLGGTFLEPNVPCPDDQLALLEDVVAFVGDPRRVHWRFDPLVSARCDDDRASNVDLDLFRSLAEPVARAGVPIVHTSFVSMYRKVRRRLEQAGVAFDEYGVGVRRDFLADLAQAADDLGMKLLTCCEPGFPVHRCIDGELLAELHPTQDACRSDRARGQRELCGCTASLDIGRYLPCPSRCLYCYAHPAVERT